MEVVSLNIFFKWIKAKKDSKETIVDRSIRRNVFCDSHR